MRNAFSQHIEKLAKQHPELIFITGDLGFNAFESLKIKLGNRFINAGIAEQSMVSMAAGMASQGHLVFVYSIAPFIVYRALEQIRNDVCFHNLPVFLVGNGGGYGYGIMGSSHHALSDIATLASLPNLNCFTPAFKEDVNFAIDRIIDEKKPAYLRLGLGNNKPMATEKFDDSYQILKNKDAKLTIISTGPVVNSLMMQKEFDTFSNKVDLFIVNKYPITELSNNMTISIKKTKRILVFEEHVSTGGLGSELANHLMQLGLEINRWKHKYAVNYPDNLYGNQAFHLKQSGLDGLSLIDDIQNLILF